jgi:aspartyl aminopeptidase
MPIPTEAEKERARALAEFVDASPTPHFAVRAAAARLEAAGFTRLDERDVWSFAPGDRRYVVRGGTTILAFVVGSEPPARGGFRMIGAHTDSPNLRTKPRFDVKKAGYRQVGVEVYGGVVLATWTDRDLAIAGRVALRRGRSIESKLVRFDRAIARVPNLAIHLNRGVNSDGLVLNQQKHLAPIVGLGDEADLATRIAAELGEKKEDILGADLSFYAVEPSRLAGFDDEFVLAPRLDNLGSCFTATEALARAAERPAKATRLVVLYDHEECGSRSAVGAHGPVLKDTLQRVVDGFGAKEPQAFERAMRSSFLVSADMAHAVHPNYEDKHEPEHQPKLGAGVVIKTNANQSYATNGETAARFTLACREAGFEPQQFVTRSDLPCGSTIGPITAAVLGVDTVDVGAPMLSMHSCREMAGTRDVALAIAAYENALSLED